MRRKSEASNDRRDNMETLRLVQKIESEPHMSSNRQPELHNQEDFRAVIRSLTEDAMKVINRIAAHEMSKPEPNAELVEECYLLFHYLDYMKRFISGIA
jgi:hypothetical protein